MQLTGRTSRQALRSCAELAVSADMTVCAPNHVIAETADVGALLGAKTILLFIQSQAMILITEIVLVAMELAMLATFVGNLRLLVAHNRTHSSA
jgi:hypothetical protein